MNAPCSTAARQKLKSGGNVGMSLRQRSVRFLRMHGRNGLNAVIRLILGPVFAWSAVLLLLEHTVKGGDAGEPDLKRDFRNGQVGDCQQLLRRLDAAVAQIAAEGEVRILLEQPGEMKLGEADGFRDLFQVQIFHIMGINVIDQIVELLYIFLPLVKLDVREQLRLIQMSYTTEFLITH